MRPKVLIVEDDALNAKLVEAILYGLDYRVMQTCSNGKAAIELASRERPDLILMDIRLEGELDGIDTAAKILETTDLPIVFLTAYADLKTVRRAIDTFEEADIILPHKVLRLIGLHHQQPVGSPLVPQRYSQPGFWSFSAGPGLA